MNKVREWLRRWLGVDDAEKRAQSCETNVLAVRIAELALEDKLNLTRVRTVDGGYNLYYQHEISHLKKKGQIKVVKPEEEAKAG